MCKWLDKTPTQAGGHLHDYDDSDNDDGDDDDHDSDDDNNDDDDVSWKHDITSDTSLRHLNLKRAA